jgi:hypothetical protein
MVNVQNQEAVNKTTTRINFLAVEENIFKDEFGRAID